MAIKNIEINGYRSIYNLKIDASDISALIGRNGSGKSNILSALNYFYNNLTEEWHEDGIFDANNLFHNEILIRISYEIKNVLNIVEHNMKSKKFEYKNYYNKIRRISKNNMIELELLKRKGCNAEWNVDYNTRQIIAALFPIYFVDARKIELTDWSNLWDLIGDFLKLQYKDSEDIQDKIKDVIVESNDAFGKKISEFKNILETSRINVKNLTSKQLGKIIAEIVAGGQIFQFEKKNLQEYSNGTNAYNYTYFLIELLSWINVYKLKEPIVILDEPEISLHIGMIDQLMECIFEASSRIQFILSTHSARCVRDLMEKEELDYIIYNVALKENYTELKRIKNLKPKEGKERVILSEVHTNSCFAKAIVNVEGTTELEVLKNKYLQVMYPTIKSVELSMGMSNRTTYNLTASGKRNYQTPGFAVIDMDQVLKWCKNNRFKFEGLINYPVNEEHYYYGKKRRDTLYLRNRIIKICKKCNFFYRFPFYSCEDPNFRILLHLVHQYYKNYNMYVWESTIEGALINLQNLEIFTEYMKIDLETEKKEKITAYYKRWRKNIQLNYIRLIYSGKSDYLLTRKQIRDQNNQLHKELYNTLNMVRKTSGWISNWLEYYFLSRAGIARSDENAFGEFKKYIADSEKKKAIEKSFMKDFRELFLLVKEIEKQVTGQ